MNKTMVMAALSAFFLAGCGGDSPAGDETGSGMDPVVRRMHDKEYVGKLEKQIDKRKAIMREMEAARQALKKAEAEGKTGEELVAFSNAVKAVVRKFEQNRAESMLLVSQQMRQDSDANAEKLQKKGK
ncbi:MAG: hypothetical protein ACI4R9_00880 [Kiritimatiellia bacterium]